ncbi:copper homeostasis membrane protein CopD [Bradyrhizobium sp. B097]|uniref:copper homeostasis membrane protein CopD n=1 Tax=Bradyrhizobium sp. B097 TaxID=3140244 RepID=UPI003183ED3C
MDWLGAGGPLIATRAIHFAATAITAGTVVFRMVVAAPVLHAEAAVAEAFRARTRRGAWIGLLVAMASGMIWLLLETASMSGRPFGDVQMLSTVLSETQFGQVTEIRLGLAVVLAASLAYGRLGGADWLAFAVALGLVASLAWTGHAGATAGEAGNLHVAADALHLCAAAAWIGGLLSLILFFATVRRTQRSTCAPLVLWATRRFSIVGIVSVAGLSVTGAVNAYFLVGSLQGLLVTEYGRLLILKLVVFAIMLALAAINRLWLTPRLALSDAGALRGLSRNSAIEFALGLVVVLMVGMLGTLHPAIHLVGP